MISWSPEHPTHSGKYPQEGGHGASFPLHWAFTRGEGSREMLLAVSLLMGKTAGGGVPLTPTEKAFTGVYFMLLFEGVYTNTLEIVCIASIVLYYGGMWGRKTNT